MNDDDPVEEKEPGLVLVGFGSNRLSDMLEWIDTPKENDLLSAFTKWPPVYRREEICEPEEIQDACRFLAFIQDAILEYELNTPEGDEEK
jgi:hypothetical protein